MKAIKALAATVAIALLLGALHKRFGTVPPLAKVLNPTTGIWKNATGKILPGRHSERNKELMDSVWVKYDESMVPHIFAKNDHDLYFTQGYETAKDRLWQMELYVRKASGRMAEIFGPAVLEQDLYYRRLQLTAVAEKSIGLMNADCAVKEMLQAYSNGVNAYIKSLNAASLPVEYKLYDCKPGEWKPVYSALIMKMMAEILTMGSDDFDMTEVRNHFGSDTTANLFPDYPYREDPVIPTGTKWNFKANTQSFNKENPVAGLTGFPGHPKTSEGIGSNNWAVNGTKTNSGFPILANDPHLQLTLPSIWYQLQLTSPGQNVYGVSIPGVPAIIIGFSQGIAWGITNAYADVTDWYQVSFRDEEHRFYAYKDNWIPVREKIERIRVRNGRDWMDTLRLTHYGPIIPAKKGNGNDAFALKWLGAEPSQEITSFYYINRATDYAGFCRALAYFTSPAQNFVYADSARHIAMVSGGKFPIKSRGQGKFILNGGDPNNEWQGWIPHEQNPSVLDPERGFVSSANQSITDTLYPYYLNWKFSPSERGRRINDYLKKLNGATKDSFSLLQNDTYSLVAADILPYMLAHVKPENLTAEKKKVAGLLEHWDRCFKRQSMEATLFNAWWGDINERIWDEFNTAAGKMAKPGRDRTIRLLLEEPTSLWLDDKRTATVEDAQAIITQSFNHVVDSVTGMFGPPGNRWRWENNKASIIEHLGGIKSFGTGFFATPGTASTVNAQTRLSGPSWRMIVALGPEVNAYGILPGGQSGNPGSYYYDNLLNDWKKGEMRRLLFLKSAFDESVPFKTIFIFKN